MVGDRPRTDKVVILSLVSQDDRHVTGRNPWMDYMEKNNFIYIYHIYRSWMSNKDLCRSGMKQRPCLNWKLFRLFLLTSAPGSRNSLAYSSRDASTKASSSSFSSTSTSRGGFLQFPQNGGSGAVSVNGSYAQSYPDSRSPLCSLACLRNIVCRDDRYAVNIDCT